MGVAVPVNLVIHGIDDVDQRLAFQNPGTHRTRLRLLRIVAQKFGIGRRNTMRSDGMILIAVVGS